MFSCIAYITYASGLCKTCGLRLAGCNVKSHRISGVCLQHCVSRKKKMTVLLRIYNSALEDGVATGCWRTTCLHTLPRKLLAMHANEYKPIANLRQLYKVFAQNIGLESTCDSARDTLLVGKCKTFRSFARVQWWGFSRNFSYIFGVRQGRVLRLPLLSNFPQRCTGLRMANLRCWICVLPTTSHDLQIYMLKQYRPVLLRQGMLCSWTSCRKTIWWTWTCLIRNYADKTVGPPPGTNWVQNGIKICLLKMQGSNISQHLPSHRWVFKRLCGLAWTSPGPRDAGRPPNSWGQTGFLVSTEWSEWMKPVNQRRIGPGGPCKAQAFVQQDSNMGRLNSARWRSKNQNCICTNLVYSERLCSNPLLLSNGKTFPRRDATSGMAPPFSDIPGSPTQNSWYPSSIR